MADTTYAKMFPSIAPSLEEGPTRAADVHLRMAAIAVAKGHAPVNAGEAQLQAEWRRLGAEARARVARDFPLLGEELERMRNERRSETREQRLAKEFPSLAKELLAEARKAGK